MVPGPNLQAALSRSGPHLPVSVDYILSPFLPRRKNSDWGRQCLDALDSLFQLLLNFSSLMRSSKSRDQSILIINISLEFIPLCRFLLPSQAVLPMHKHCNPEFSRFKFPLAPAVASAPGSPCTVSCGCLSVPLERQCLPALWTSCHFSGRGKE